MAKVIPLTKGYSTIVDDQDYDSCSKFKWYADVKPSGQVYAIRRIRVGLRKLNKRVTIRLHRFLLNAPSSLLVDHIDGDSLNNCRENLRLASHIQNSWNHHGQSKRRKSSYKGVKKNRACSTWSARITVAGQLIYLGSFSSEIEAAVAYNNAAKQYHGAFARMNNV